MASTGDGHSRGTACIREYGGATVTLVAGRLQLACAHEIADFLLQLGTRVVPHVKRILAESDDRSWQYWIMIGLIQRLPRALVKEIQLELLSIAKQVDEDEAHLVAFEILVKHRLLDAKVVEELLDEKKQRCPGSQRDLARIRELWKEGP